MRILLESLIINIFRIYAPQSGRSEAVKNSFHSHLLSNISSISPEGNLVVCNDFNGHVEEDSTRYENMHGGYGFRMRNDVEVKVLNLGATSNMAITDTFFQKLDNKKLSQEMYQLKLTTVFFDS